MEHSGWNPELARVVLIFAFVAITILLRAIKFAQTSRPSGVTRPSPLDHFRQAMQRAERQRLEQRLSGSTTTPIFFEPPVADQETIKPESALVPSLLLIVLVLCLGWMAYLHFAG